MKTVNLEICVDSWYAHAPAGGMRLWYYGGSYRLTYKKYYKHKYLDPHEERYLSVDKFIMEMINEAIGLLTQPCFIKLTIPEDSFIYKIMNKQVYVYWKRNNWRYKDGRDVPKYWIEYECIINNAGHEVVLTE